MSHILLDENAIAPDTPATNKVAMYAKSDGLCYTKDDAGTETAFAIQVPVSVANGGTAIASYAVGDMIYASGTTTLSKLAAVAVGQVIISQGVATAPIWSANVSVASFTASAVAALTTAAESWVGPSSTTGVYFKSGNVGIGIASLNNKLQLHEPAALPCWMQLSNGTTGSGATDGFYFGIATTGDVFFWNSEVGNQRFYTSGSEQMRLTPVGNLSVGGTVDRATTVGTKAIQIFNGTAPVGTLANGVSLYSVAGKLWAMDAAGAATQLTP